MTEEQQTSKYISGLKYHIQECVILRDVFSVDKAYNRALKAERLQSKAPPFRRPHRLNIQQVAQGVQPNSTMADQPPTHRNTLRGGE